MRWFTPPTPTDREAQLARELASEQAEHEATKRKLRVAEAEIESLAAVIARDRARIEAETSAYNRRRAENEGTTRHVGLVD